MRLSFKVWPHHVKWPEFRDFWLEADRIPQYRAGWVYDHFEPQTGWNAHEPLREPRGDCFEAWTVLSHISALTERVRFGTLVSSITHRHPSVLAKMISTMDELSGGRVEVGIGAGWNAAEHERFGIDYPGTGERFDRLDEYLAVLSTLLQEGDSTFDGRFYSLKDAYCLPGPVQLPRPPLTVGGKGPKRALPLVAKWADHWNYPSGPIDEFRATRALLGELCEGYGRSLADIDVSVQFKYTGMDALLAGIDEHLEAGARHAIVWFNPPLDPRALGTIADAVSSAFDVETAEPSVVAGPA